MARPAKAAKAASKGAAKSIHGDGPAASGKAKADTKDTRALTDDARWDAELAEVEETDNPLNVPYDVFPQEAGAAAGFVDRRWDPRDNQPGLRRVQKRLPRDISEEIRSLVHEVQHAQTALLLIIDPVVINQGERGRFLVDELESALEFLLDDGVEEPADKQLAQLKEFHAQDGQRSTALAQSLRDYAALAESLKDRLVDIDDEFDPALIQEARDLAQALAAPEVPAAPLNADASAALARRNRLLHVLMRRVMLVRRTASRVFAHHPAILREVTSAYERRRRAAARREKVRSEQAAKNASKQAPKGAPEQTASGGATEG